MKRKWGTLWNKHLIGTNSRWNSKINVNQFVIGLENVNLNHKNDLIVNIYHVDILKVKNNEIWVEKNTPYIISPKNSSSYYPLRSCQEEGTMQQMNRLIKYGSLKCEQMMFWDERCMNDETKGGITAKGLALTVYTGV